MTAQIEMPRYRSHKEVWAFKIQSVKVRDDGQHYITPVEQGYAPVDVSQEYMTKHQPKEGGYFVVYPPDGYRSWSPAKQFEDGYTRVN